MAMSLQEEYALAKLVFDLYTMQQNHASYRDDLKTLRKYLSRERERADRG